MTPPTHSVQESDDISSEGQPSEPINSSEENLKELPGVEELPDIEESLYIEESSDIEESQVAENPPEQEPSDKDLSDDAPYKSDMPETGAAEDVAAEDRKAEDEQIKQYGEFDWDSVDWDLIERLDAVASGALKAAPERAANVRRLLAANALEPEPDPNAPRTIIINEEVLKENPGDRKVTLITEEKNPRDHTYIIIGGQKLDLHDPAALEQFENSGSIANGSSVKLSLAFEINSGNIREQDYIIYNLPKNLEWDDKFGAIYNRNDPNGAPVGTYAITNNTIIVQYSKEFLENNGMIDTRITADGRVLLDEGEEEGTRDFDFEGIGTIEDVKIETKADLQIEKNVQNDHVIINNSEEGDYTETSITVYYLIEMEVIGDTGATISDIHIHDTLSSIVGGDTDTVEMKFLTDTFTFGTGFNNDDSREKIKNIELTENEYSFDVEQWTKEDGKLYITYAINFIPQLAEYDPSSDISADTQILIKNNLTSTIGETPGPSAEDTFAYNNGMVDKKGSPVTSESYTADWTATYNDYAPIAGANLGLALIGDTLEQDEFDDTGEPTGNKIIIHDIEPIDIDAMVNGELNPDNWNLENFSITAYDAVNGIYASSGRKLTDDNIIDEGMFHVDSYGDIITEISSILDFAKAYFMTAGEYGVKVPTTTKYVIKYRTRLHPDFENEPNDLTSKVDMKNSASNGPDILPDGGSVTDGVGVGPAKPTLSKTYKAAADNPSNAEWQITTEIRDPKIQIKGSLIYDYISKGHTIDETVPIGFYVYDEDASDFTLLGTIPWSETSVVTLGSGTYVENQDSAGNLISPVTSENKYNENFKENFKVDLLAALKFFSDSEHIIDVNGNEGLAKTKYKLTYQTTLSLDPDSGVETSGSAFIYRNNAFMVFTDDTVSNVSANTTRSLISKTNLDNNNTLFKAATGKDLSELDYQEIPWYMTAMVLNDELALTDAYRKTYSTDGDMSFVEGSLVVYQTTKDNYASSGFDWENDAEIVPESEYTFTKTYFEDTGLENGFVLSFKSGSLRLDSGNRVIVFFLTRGGDDYDNNISLRYFNSVSPNYDVAVQPVASDYTTRNYSILNKAAQPNSPDTPTVITYTVNVNNSRLDLFDDSDTLELTDTLKQNLTYIAGSMKFYEMVLDDNGRLTQIEHENGSDGYSIDAHEQTEDGHDILKITVPDKTYVRLVYECSVAYPRSDSEAINEIHLTANKDYSARTTTVIRILEHDAEASGQNFLIRVFKYDEYDPINALPGAYFRISAYDPYRDDETGTRKLEFVTSRENPVEGITDENGEFVFTGIPDVVYKVEEIRSPEGYAVSNAIEYFCFTGYRSPDDYQGILDENGKEINPYINVVSDVSEFRFIVGNKPANTAVKLIKKNQNGDLLSGAEFELKKEGEDKSTLLTTDDNGELVISYLDEGEYYLTEITPPEGHLLMTEPLHFSYDGETIFTFDENEAIESYESATAPEIYNILTVIDEKSDDVSIKVSKTWDDWNNIDNYRPSQVTVNLYQIWNGEREIADTKLLSDENKWTYTFDNLPTVKEGSPATYEVEEERVDWYLSETVTEDDGSITFNNIHRPWFPQIPNTPGSYGNLYILKTVTGEALKDIEYEFKLDITFPDGREYTDTFEIKPGTEVLYDYIDQGAKVNVIETDSKGYTITYTLDDEVVDEISFTIDKDAEVHVVVNNHGDIDIPDRSNEGGGKAAGTGDQNSTAMYFFLLIGSLILSGLIAARRYLN